MGGRIASPNRWRWGDVRRPFANLLHRGAIAMSEPGCILIESATSAGSSRQITDSWADGTRGSRLELRLRPSHQSIPLTPKSQLAKPSRPTIEANSKLDCTGHVDLDEAQRRLRPYVWLRLEGALQAAESKTVA
jgi:hypothetical protein